MVIKVKKTLFLCLLIVLNICVVEASSNPYKEKGPYGINCTWYAWNIAKEKGGVSLPALGDAKNWYINAKNKGYSVGNTPKPNSIVVWDNWTSYGHVGYIEKVEGNILYVWDSTGPCIDREDPEFIECMANGVSEESDKICYANAKKIACEYTISPSDYVITGYIYLDEVPTQNVDNLKEEEKIQEVTKSNNAYLSNIILSEGKIDFDKNQEEYNLTLENNFDKIEINATLEDSKAVLSGNGIYNLNSGENKIILKVTAEDNSTKEYVINIVRKEKGEEENIIVNEDSKAVKNDNKRIHISLYSIMIIIVIMIYFYRKKKKHE